MKLIHIIFIPLVLLTACAGKFESKLNFDRQERLRVAVLPTVRVDSSGAPIAEDDDLLIDNVEIVSSKAKSLPSELVFKEISSNLRNTTLDAVSPALVNNILLHHGYANELELDSAKILSATPADLCALIGCDAIVRSRVTRWSRDYYAIQSVASVGIEIEILGARGHTKLFTARGEDQESRGIIKGPTGISDLVLEPIRGLNSAIIADLARKTVREMMRPLFAEKRDLQPGAETPSLPEIWAAAHDAHTGNITHDHYLSVVALGSGGAAATFSIGDVIVDVPMNERDGGHYIGEYYPLARDAFTNLPVVVTLEDGSGRKVTREIVSSKVSLPPRR